MHFFRPPKKSAWISCGIAVAISGAVVAIAVSPLFGAARASADNLLYQLQLARESVRPSSEIVIVAIDDKTLADPRFGRWQDWRRDFFADLIQKLEPSAPRLIGLDITFSEVSADDARLAAAIQSAGNVVLAGRVDAAFGGLLPVPQLESAAAGVGHANLVLESDNAVRRNPLQIDFGTGQAPLPVNAFAAELASLAAAAPLAAPPLDRDGNFLIRYFGRPYSFSSVSFVDVIDGRIDASQLANKIVLVGVTPADLRDLEATPVSRGIKMPGVEIHANALQTLLDQQPLRRATDLEFGAAVLALVGLAGFAASRLRLTFGMLALLGLAAGYLGFAHLAFSAGILFGLLLPLAGLVITFAAIYGQRYLTEQREKRELKSAFGRYVSSELVDRILDNPAALRLGGEKKELTLFFSDLANFTAFSEKLPPEDLVEVLNSYLGEMTEIILKSGGTLDKYIGDAIMAFWGAPLPHESPARAAVMAALDQQAALQRMIDSGVLPPDIPVRARMGIHTGPVVVGNMGSKNRFNYTAMGDSVNLASRLEGVNKIYGTLICISESTYELVKKDIEARELDSVAVKGKAKPVKIYEVVARRGELSPAQKKAFPEYAAGLAAYRAQEFAAAESHFEAVLTFLPEDGPATALFARCQKYRKDPPPADWDGVHRLTKK